MSWRYRWASGASSGGATTCSAALSTPAACQAKLNASLIPQADDPMCRTICSGLGMKASSGIPKRCARRRRSRPLSGGHGLADGESRMLTGIQDESFQTVLRQNRCRNRACDTAANDDDVVRTTHELTRFVVVDLESVVVRAADVRRSRPIELASAGTAGPSRASRRLRSLAR